MRPLTLKKPTATTGSDSQAANAQSTSQGGGPVEVIRVPGVLKLAVWTMKMRAAAYLSSRCSFHRCKPFTHSCASVFSMRSSTNW
jgi:hypothetical protein